MSAPGSSVDAGGTYRNQLRMQFERDYNAEAYVERAVRNACPKIIGPAPRWVAVMDTFGCGSGYAHELCRRFGLDPDTNISGARELT